MQTPIHSEVREEIKTNLPRIITQRNMGNYFDMQYYRRIEDAYKGPNCIAIWHIRYKSLRMETMAQIDVMLHFLREWQTIQMQFHDAREKYAESGIEFMGDLSQFWTFDEWYRVQIGEIKLQA